MFRFISALRSIFKIPIHQEQVTDHLRDCGTIDGVNDERDVVRFAPELFETRTDVIAELADRGFDWLSHYSSVDPIHDCYGIEVCGIHNEHDADVILDVLIE